MVEEMIVSCPVIIDNGRLLTVMDNKDEFYKLPGGRVKEDDGLEETCIKEAFLEVNAKITIVKELSPLVLSENPTTRKKMRIELHHYLSELHNLDEIRAIPPIKRIKWMSFEDIKRMKYPIAPNIKFLFEKGELK